MSEVLRVEDLSLSIGTTSVVRHVFFSIAAGEILGLVGGSGSGKSMTALSVLGLLPDGARMTGRVELRGETVSGISETRMRKLRGRDLAMIFQEPASALNPLMCIGDQVAETARLHGVDRASARIAACDALAQAGLSRENAQYNCLPHELSGGQRQRVAIAIAMVMKPCMLIADEPTTALDVITQAQVLYLLRDLARSQKMGLLLITHDLAVISQVADRVAVMSEGAILEQGATKQVLKHAREPYTRSLLAAARSHRKERVSHRTESATVLEVENVVHDYARTRRTLFRPAVPLRAVDGVSLIIRAGETVGLVGESGSGKSTLLRVVLGLQKPGQGRVILRGHAFAGADVRAGRVAADVKRLRRDIQAVFQDPVGSFDPRWTVGRLVGEPFFLLDGALSMADRVRRVAEVLEQVGLNAGDARRYPREFSGGQRQRIAIARALVTHPAVVVFDEAVSALDVLVRGQVLEVLAQLSERLGLACLFVSHDLHVVRAVADRVYVMQAGRIVEEGETESVFGAPRHPYTRALLDATPELPASTDMPSVHS